MRFKFSFPRKNNEFYNRSEIEIVLKKNREKISRV